MNIFPQDGWQQFLVTPLSFHVEKQGLDQNDQVRMNRVKKTLESIFESFSISSALFDVTERLHHFTETLPDAGPLIIYMYEIYLPLSELFQNCLRFTVSFSHRSQFPLPFLFHFPPAFTLPFFVLSYF